MNNPLKGWYSDLFGSRGVDVAAALNYVDELAVASSDAIAVQTAARVLLNTVIGAVDQILASRSPEKLAILELIDARINAHAEKMQDNIDDIIKQWVGDNLDIDDQINDWVSNNLDLHDHNISDIITDWMNNNLDDKIADMDLVVRVR
jgi:hypothetical protein